MRLTLLNSDLNYFIELISRIHDYQVENLIPYFSRHGTALIEVGEYYFVLHNKTEYSYELSISFTTKDNFVNTKDTYYGGQCNNSYTLLSIDKTFNFIYGDKSAEERILLNQQIFDKYFNSEVDFEEFNKMINPMLKQILEDIT